MKKLELIKSLITILLLISITVSLFLYTSGYRVRKKQDTSMDIEQTGMISAKSIPEGAAVYIDGKLITATDDTIPGISQGLHNLRMTKKGFFEWEKDIEVYEALVTDITAVLVAQSPRIEPLTTTGAQLPVISPSLKQIAYFSNDVETPGVWVIPLNDGLTLFRSNPGVVLQNTKFNTYSDGTSIEWSPDEKYLLVESSSGTFHKVNIDTHISETVLAPEELRKEWYTKQKVKRESFIEKSGLSGDIADLAKADSVVWSPDNEKFLYKKVEGNVTSYWVYNTEDPLPIGESENNQVFEIIKGDPEPAVTWYTDSFHLIVVEMDNEAKEQGKVSLIRIDGTNKSEIYNNRLYSDRVYGTPSGDKIIVLTTFKSGGQTDLYTISLR
jgi:hypothetical protein